MLGALCPALRWLQITPRPRRPPLPPDPYRRVMCGSVAARSPSGSDSPGVTVRFITANNKNSTEVQALGESRSRDVGGAGISAEGEVYNLANPADLSGNYSAYTAGITVGEGGSIAYLKNEKGVVIALHSQTGGLRFNLAASGVKVTLQPS